MSILHKHKSTKRTKLKNSQIKFFYKYSLTFQTLLLAISILLISFIFKNHQLSPKIAEVAEPETFGQAIKLTNLATFETPTAIEVPVSLYSDNLSIWWTIEGWFKPEYLGKLNRPQYLFFMPLYEDQYSLSGNSLYLDTSNNLVAEILLHSGKYITFRTEPLTNAWHHVAISDDLDNCYLLVDGIIKARTYNKECREPINTPDFQIVQPIHVGSEIHKVLSGTEHVIRRGGGFIGQIDDFRFTNSSANIYKKDFEVQKYPFPDQSGEWLYKFNNLGAESSIEGFGTKSFTAHVRGSNFTLINSTVPFLLPSPSPLPSISASPSALPTPSLIPSPASCTNTCGNNVCEEVTCQGLGCSCAESVLTCPQDCLVSPREISKIIIYAAGTPYNKVYPSMTLKINGQAVANWKNVKGNANLRVFKQYTYQSHIPLSPNDTIQVVYSNDESARNLRVDKIVMNGISYESEVYSTISTGTQTSKGLCGTLRHAKSEWLHCNGYFEY